MSAAPKIPPFAAIATDLAKSDAVRPDTFPIDAALSQRGPGTYATRRLPFVEVIRLWLACIIGERLTDVTIPNPFALGVDYRDGALTRGAGGLAYTPHAWSQLVSLFKVNRSPIPDGIASVDRWHSPIARHFGFEDIKRTSRRPREGEEIVLRTFRTSADGRYYTALRAVVTGRHGLTDTDDSNVIRVLEGLEEQPIEGRVSRGWDKTYGSFVLDSGDSDVRLGFGFANSETGCGSIEFNGSILIRALDTEITLPSGERGEQMITIAAGNAGTRRRHTLPRYDSRSGKRLTDGQRTAIAQDRIGTDVAKALDGARVLAQRWGLARADVLVDAVRFASIASADDSAVTLLWDFFSDHGYSKLLESRGDEASAKAFLRELAKVIADDARLRSLPHGSAAHMAAAFALLATAKERTWEETRELQAISASFVMEGWKR